MKLREAHKRVAFEKLWTNCVRFCDHSPSVRLCRDTIMNAARRTAILLAVPYPLVLSTAESERQKTLSKQQQLLQGLSRIPPGRYDHDVAKLPGDFPSRL